MLRWIGILFAAGIGLAIAFVVGVRFSDGPLGPFTIRRKLFDRAIDAHLFRDDDGRAHSTGPGRSSATGSTLHVT